ncbi:glycoside hydrolase family 3 [Paenibacillus crassostreae]|nr:glycoside hydrolase family 3 [Paenibacillus crassostreae]
MIFICFITLLSGCNSTTQDETSQSKDNNLVTEDQIVAPIVPTEPTEPTDTVQDLLNSMSTEEKIGQLVVVGMDGTMNNEDNQAFIEDYHVGGFIFYKDNIETIQQALSLFNELKLVNEVNKIPLWMSIDEEGGRVTRMPDEFLELPTNQVIGKKNDPVLSNKIGQILGRELLGFGLNMNFAPVLDIHSNPNNPVIGNRSFGDGAELVSALGIATMQGLQSQGVVPVVKHFPGHGDTSVDSHIGLPVIEHDLERLRKLELIPFQNAINEGADVVMIAHLLLPKVDADYPASFSKIVISDILRDELGFNGVIITDDMTMGAIAENYDLGQTSVQSVLAGTNIVLVGHDVQKVIAVIQALTDAVENGKISEDVLNNRVYAILKLKEKVGINNDPAVGPDVEKLNKDIRNILDQMKE